MWETDGRDQEHTNNRLILDALRTAMDCASPIVSMSRKDDDHLRQPKCPSFHSTRSPLHADIPRTIGSRAICAIVDVERRGGRGRSCRDFLRALLGLPTHEQRQWAEINVFNIQGDLVVARFL